MKTREYYQHCSAAPAAVAIWLLKLTELLSLRVGAQLSEAVCRNSFIALCVAAVCISHKPAGRMYLPPYGTILEIATSVGV